MIEAEFFVKCLKENSIDFFTGVPDSLLKSFCAYIQDNAPKEKHIIAANEGGAMALASGHYLATGKPALVYLQNSGMGNIINPLLSLNDPKVYGIPLMLLIGWRGEPGVKDEPQHIKQGEVSLELLDAMGIVYSVITPDTDSKELEQLISQAQEYFKDGRTFALIVKKGSFAPYKLKQIKQDFSDLRREDAIETITKSFIGKEWVVATTGQISRELFEIREKNKESHERDFLTVGSMGHASQIASGISLAHPSNEVYCLDGDGAFIMHMGNAAISASLKLKGFHHIMLNNAAHDSVGGQPTLGDQLDLLKIAQGVGYPWYKSVDNEKDLNAALKDMKESDGPHFLEIKVKKGARPDLGRPTLTPEEQKDHFMKSIREG